MLSCRVVVKCHGDASKCMQLKSCRGFQSWIVVGVMHFGLCCIVVLCCAKALHQNVCNLRAVEVVKVG